MSVLLDILRVLVLLLVCLIPRYRPRAGNILSIIFLSWALKADSQDVFDTFKDGMAKGQAIHDAAQRNPWAEQGPNG
jgi:hypothetical protein